MDADSPPRTHGPRISRPAAILFLCHMNAIRSPMAEAIARSLLRRSTYVASAGVEHGERDPFVDAILSERGLAASEHGPQRFEDLEDAFFDVIVTLAPEAHRVAMEAADTISASVEFWPMPDPSTQEGSRERVLEGYRELADRIAAQIANRFPDLVRE